MAGVPKEQQYQWVEPFLEAFAQTANVGLSAKTAGITRQRVFQHRRASPEFAERYRHAEDDAVDALEAEMRRRAMVGTEKPIFHEGREIARIRQYSDTLAIFLAKAHRPEKFRERHHVEHGGRVGGTAGATVRLDLSHLTVEQLRALRGLSDAQLEAIGRGALVDAESAGGPPDGAGANGRDVPPAAG